MKKLQYIIFLVLAGVLVFSCKPESAVTSIDPSLGYSVYFAQAAGRGGEGDTVQVNIVVNASAAERSGGSHAFKVTPPSPVAYPESASYVILDMNNQPLTSTGENTYALPANDGVVSFKFTSVDNDWVDGNRIFTLALTSSSLPYPIKTPNAMNISVSDDEVVITREELLGTWNVTENASNGTPDEYEVTIAAGAGDNDIVITGMSHEPTAILKATVDLSAKVKTMSIGMQQIATWNSSYLTYFCAVVNNSYTKLPASSLEKGEKGFTITFAPDQQGNSYMVLAVTPTGSVAGSFYAAKNVVMTKSID